MGADSTLVQAAYKLGQSKVPGDYSDIFNKQYEGLIASNKARYKAMGDGFKALGSAAESVIETVREREAADMETDNLLFNNAYEEVATDAANGSLKKSGNEYKDGSAQNVGHIAAANTKFDSLKDQLSTLAHKSFLSKDDKKLQADLRRKTEKMKKNLVTAKGNVIANTAAYLEGHVNNDLSFKGSPDEQLLFAQVHDPNADLDSLGVRVYWDDNEELQYEYTSNRLQAEYEKNNGGIIDGYKGEVKTISAKKLASMMRLKGVKVNNDANALINKAGSGANETIGKTKNLAHESFDRLGDSIYNDYKALFFNEKTDIEDLATREVLVGNTNRTYKNDLGSNGGIDKAVINQLGIGSDIFTEADLNGNGKLDAGELAKHEGAKAEIIEKLTNPQTNSEREVAASELARYWTLHARSEFDYMRKQNVPETVNKGGGGGGNSVKHGGYATSNQGYVTTRPKSGGGEPESVPWGDAQSRRVSLDKLDYISGKNDNYTWDNDKKRYIGEIDGEEFTIWDVVEIEHLDRIGETEGDFKSYSSATKGNANSKLGRKDVISKVNKIREKGFLTRKKSRYLLDMPAGASDKYVQDKLNAEYGELGFKFTGGGSDSIIVHYGKDRHTFTVNRKSIKMWGDGRKEDEDGLIEWMTNMVRIDDKWDSGENNEYAT